MLPRRSLVLLPLLCSFVASVAPHCEAGESYVFSHFAGGGGGALKDETGVAAHFLRPTGVVIDGSGTVYVADLTTIRRFRDGGVVTTLAGAAGASGKTDGVGSEARFGGLAGLALDRAGNIFVADDGNHVIRKITQDGVVTTFAGSGQSGSADGPAGEAHFFSPVGLAFDPAGNLYVADTNHTIRKIAPDGYVSTVAGKPLVPGYANGLGATVRLSTPMGVVCDHAGNVFVADMGNDVVRKISPDGEVTTFAGIPRWENVDGAGGPTRLSNPYGIAADSAGNFYVADFGSGTLKKITADGRISLVAGGPSSSGYADGTGGNAHFLSPVNVTIDGSGNAYVSDYVAKTIRKVTPDGVTTTAAGVSPPQHGTIDSVGGDARFWYPQDIAADAAGNLYVTDWGTIRRISPAGVVSTYNRGNGGLNGAYGVTVDSAGNVYATSSGGIIWKITPSGDVIWLAGDPSLWGSDDGMGRTARFKSPRGIATDRSGNLYVTDTGNETIRKITPAGLVTTLAGVAQQSGSADGVGTEARFNDPTGIAVDADGTVFVSDSGNGTIRAITPAGRVTTLAGTPGTYGSVDGQGAAARFVQPHGLVLDAAGNLIVTDFGDHTIRKITRTGMVTTIGGLTGSSGNEDGLGRDARFFAPSGVAVGSAGELFIADCNNGAVRRAIVSTSRLANLSARAFCGTGNNVTIGGFVVSGSGSKRVLIRAIGPSLTGSGLNRSEVLLDPVVEVHKGSNILALNDDWATNANKDEVRAVSTKVGANPLAADDVNSSVMLLDLPMGVYSFVVSGKGGSSGVVLLEVYDADPEGAPSAFVNIATRAYATTGNGVTIGGFVISGNAPKRVMLRGVGPTLAAQGLGQRDLLDDPIIELHKGALIVGLNDGWDKNSNATLIPATSARVGATPLDVADTKSSTLLLVLEPGVYSFIASGTANASGIVLVEVYDAD